MNGLRHALRSLRREWHLPELRTLVAALLLAVLALGTVGTLSSRVERAVLMSAAEVIGGDMGVNAATALPDEFLQHAHALGLQTSELANFPSVAFANQRSQLLEVIAADAHWPLRGKLVILGTRGRDLVAHAPPRGEVYLDHRALVALDLHVGERVQLGGRELAIAAQLQREPDGGGLFALAPRAVMALADAQAAGLLGTGSRAHHRLLVAGDPSQVEAYSSWAKANLPSNADLITPREVQERLRVAFDRAGAFLRLSALLAALLSGIAIALAARRYARRKLDEIALLRALGASRGFTFGGLLLTLLVPALIAATIGACIAVGLAAAAFAFAHDLLPPSAQQVPLPIGPAIASAGIGLAVLIGFALPPLARLAQVPPIAVFRRTWTRAPRRFDALYLLPLGVALALIALESGSWKLAGILAASLLGAALASMALAAALLWLIRRYAARLHPSLRLGASALTRRRLLSLMQACAISLGLTALLMLAVIAPSLLDNWRRELPSDAPNWFVVNVQDAQQAPVLDALKQLGATRLNTLPVAVGKLTSINGTPVDQIKFQDRQARDTSDRQLRLSWSAQLPPANKLIAGQWFDASPTQAEVSVDKLWADTFDLHVGDTLGFLVGERSTDARVSSIREVDWSSFNVNFFLLLDPAHGSALPHDWIASFHLPRGHANALAAFSRDYPNLSLIDVDELLDRVREIVAQVTGAARWVLGFSLLAGALVLAAALTASAAERRQEAALLRTLGARRGQLLLSALCEFALLGLISGATALFGAAAAGAWLAGTVFRIHAFVEPWGALASAAVIAAAVVTALGLTGTRQVLRTSPLLILRRA
ncbi:MAG TPA: FtsX-like permease family protein [Rhodanobacteraceae bacterium]|nr:FtsX-like permease family protein [Rhodanobacteraceae bacterium]